MEVRIEAGLLTGGNAKSIENERQLLDTSCRSEAKFGHLKRESSINVEDSDLVINDHQADSVVTTGGREAFLHIRAGLHVYLTKVLLRSFGTASTLVVI